MRCILYLSFSFFTKIHHLEHSNKAFGKHPYLNSLFTNLQRHNIFTLVPNLKSTNCLGSRFLLCLKYPANYISFLWSFYLVRSFKNEGRDFWIPPPLFKALSKEGRQSLLPVLLVPATLLRCSGLKHTGTQHASLLCRITCILPAFECDGCLAICVNVWVVRRSSGTRDVSGFLQTSR